MTMDQDMYDVFVSGAGPVGLFYAYQMLQMGHSVYLCDYKSGPTRETRAFGITPRTLEILAMQGIVHHFLKEATIIRGGQFFSNGSLLGAINIPTEVQTPFAHMTMVPQDVNEEILGKLIENTHPGTIRWRTALVDYEERTDHVEAVVRQKADGSTHTVRARFMIGADGTHSVVRKQYKGDNTWRYDGKEIATQFVLADVTMTGRDLDVILCNRANVFSHPDGMCGLFPLSKHVQRERRFRVFCNLGEYSEKTDAKGNVPTHGLNHDKDTITLEEIRDIVAKRVAPFELVPTNPTWVSSFRINERKANGYRRGRMFVMGDAAHCHSPAGGQGLNIGVQDAHNLAWKMSLVLNNYAADPEKLLDSYSIEREPIAEAVLAATGSFTKAFLSRPNFISKWIIAGAFYAFTSIERLNNLWGNKMMQAWIQTRIGDESPVLLSSTLGESGSFIPDTAALQQRILFGDQVVRKSVREILASSSSATHVGKHVLLWIGTRPPTHSECPWTRDFWDKTRVLREHKNVVRAVVVESLWHTSSFDAPAFAEHDIEEKNLEDDFWLESNWQATDSLTHQTGLSAHIYDKEPPAALLLVRPDSYIAYSRLIRSPQDIDAALQLLQQNIVI